MNNYKTLALALCLSMTGAAMAQNSAGGISEQGFVQRHRLQQD